MRFFRRMALFALAATAIACKKDSVGPVRDPGPSRALLDGDYDCVEFRAFYQGNMGLGYYRGSCRAYLTITNPTRSDSIETFPFTIFPSNDVSRIDFPSGFGALSYDSSTSIATISYPSRPNDVFDVSLEGGLIFFDQTLFFDFSGDGQADSLFLTFIKQ